MPTLHEFITTVKEIDRLLRSGDEVGYRYYRAVLWALNEKAFKESMEIIIEDAEGPKTLHWTPKQIKQNIEKIIGVEP